MDKCLPLLPFFCTVVYALGDIIQCKATIPSKLYGMELVQKIARLGSGTGESGETIPRAKYCTTYE